MAINAHENVIKTIREEGLDLEDIFASIYTLADDIQRTRLPSQQSPLMTIDLQYIIAYAIEGRKIVAGKE